MSKSATAFSAARAASRNVGATPCAFSRSRHQTIALAEHAEVIRTLGKRVVADVIEIGRRLTDAKARCQHGNWLPWLEREFGWTDKTAERFMSASQLFGGKIDKLSNLDIPVSGLYLLAQPSLPPEVRTEVIDRAEAGERFTHAQVKAMVAEGSDKLQQSRSTR